DAHFPMSLLQEALDAYAALARRVDKTDSAAAVVQADVPTAPVNVVAVVTTAAPVKFDVPSSRRRRGVVIRDLEEESFAKTPTETKSKDK
nr:hypothetical protein [Tanacetum cinerariifolium]